METLSRRIPAVCILLILSLSLNLYGITWGLPTGGENWANDSLAPLGPLVYAKRLIFQEPWSSKYPPFHYMVLAAAYAPYMLYLYFTDELTSPTDVYPYGFEDPERSLSVFILIARVVSALMGTGTVLVTYYTAKVLYGDRAGFISGLLVASSYAVLYYSHTANVDVPQLFWISLALYSFVLLFKTYETKYYILLGLFSAFAIATKDSAYALFLGFFPLLLWFHVRHEQMTGNSDRFLSTLFHRKLLYGFLAFGIPLVLVFSSSFGWQGIVDHIQTHLQVKGSVKGNRLIADSASAFQGDLTLLTKYLSYLLQGNGLPAFLLLVGGFFYCLVRFPANSWMLIVPLITYYIFFLRLHRTEHLRYILPVYLLLTWQAGKLAIDFLEYKPIPKLLSTTAILLIVVYCLMYGFSLDLLLLHDSRYAVEKWLRENISDTALVAAPGPAYSLPRFPADMQVQYIDIGKGTTDPRSLVPLTNSRVAGTVYSAGDFFSLTLNATDTVPHTLSLYFVDWNSHRRRQIVTLYDAITNEILDQRTLANFHTGVYYTYRVRGSIRIELTRIGDGPAVLSGIFWDSAVEGKIQTHFVGTDSTTQGSWRNRYGNAGFILTSCSHNKQDIVDLPPYISSYYYSSNMKRWVWKPSEAEETGAIDADYIVLGMNTPTRVKHRSQIYQALHEAGYRLAASFKSESPIFDVQLFHTVNPRIAIFKRIDDYADCWEACSEPGQ